MTSSFSIATWNVNSIKARLPHLLEWLKRERVDIVLLQELKCVEDAFPFMEIEELGYHCAVFGEKTYNGVAILSKFRLEDVQKGLPEWAHPQARYIEAVASLPGGAVRVASVYVPNGQEVGSDKYAFKLEFLQHLHAHAARLLAYDEMCVIGGDYNVAPYDIDVHAPRVWENTVLCHADARAGLRRLLHGGYADAFRLKHASEPGYSWWDYRGNALAMNDGLRIDHLLLSPQAADRLLECRVEMAVRAQEKASDHAPVGAVFAWG